MVHILSYFLTADENGELQNPVRFQTGLTNGELACLSIYHINESSYNFAINGISVQQFEYSVSPFHLQELPIWFIATALANAYVNTSDNKILTSCLEMSPFGA